MVFGQEERHILAVNIARIFGHGLADMDQMSKYPRVRQHWLLRVISE
jgi:hypothetical protein